MTSAWGSISQEILINICSRMPSYTDREADHYDEYEFGDGVAASRLACRHWAASVPHSVKSLCVRGDFPVGSLSRNLSGLERLTWEKVKNWDQFTAPSVRALVLKFAMPSDLFRHVVESFPGIQSLQLLRVVVSPGGFDLSPLASLTSLRSLVIIGDRNTITGLESLCNLTSLTLREYKKDILHLLPSRLESLGMVDCTLDLMHMYPVSRLALLTALDLSSSRIHGGLIPLTKLSSLTTLNLHSSSVCDIRPLAKLTSLTTLDISWCTVHNGIKPLADFTSLKSLTIHWPGRFLYGWGYLVVLRRLTGLERLSIVTFDEDDDEVKEYVLASLPFPIVFV
jgi:hypothetical protein